MRSKVWNELFITAKNIFLLIEETFLLVSDKNQIIVAFHGHFYAWELTTLTVHLFPTSVWCGGCGSRSLGSV